MDNLVDQKGLRKAETDETQAGDTAASSSPLKAENVANIKESFPDFSSVKTASSIPPCP